MQHDTIVDNGPGNVVLLDMQNVLQALATCLSGPIQPSPVTPGMFWLDTSVPPNGYLRQRNRDNTDWALVAGVPDKASADEAIAGLDNSKYLTPLGVAQAQAARQSLARNRLVNPAMQVSQENGNTAGTTTGYYPNDQWACAFVAGAHSFQWVGSPTPRGSLRRIRWTVTTAKASPLAAGDFAEFYQYVEGIRVADFGWGAAGARRVILRFGFRGPTGTYCARIANGAANRAYVKTFVISAAQANIDTEQVIAIPGDVTGTWPVDNTLGLQFTVALAAGTTFIGTDGIWQAGNILAGAGMTNGMDTVGNVFELFDAGLYVDLDGTGVPPRWQAPDEPTETRACQRYYCQVVIMYSNNIGVAATWLEGVSLPVDLRATPTFAAQPAGNAQSSNFPASGTYTFLAPRTVREGRAATAGATSSFFQNVVAVNARM